MEQLQQWLATAWAWLNEPLPVVGVSVLIICTFVWKVFASTSFGKRQIANMKKKIEEWNAEAKSQMASIEAEKKKLEELASRQNEEIERLRSILERVCSSIKNKKLRELADELKEARDGKEETDCDPKEE